MEQIADEVNQRVVRQRGRPKWQVDEELLQNFLDLKNRGFSMKLIARELAVPYCRVRQYRSIALDRGLI